MAWYDVVMLDRLVVKTGSLSGSDTQWTLGFNDDSLDTIVLGPDFSSPGDIVTIDSNSSGTVQVDGQDLTTGDVAIGRSYTMAVELTRPYVRDFNGVADFDAYLTIRQIIGQHRNTGQYRFRSVYPNRSDRTKALDVDPVEDGYLRAWLNGRAKDTRMFLEATSAKPATITGLEWIVDYVPRMGAG